MSIKILRNSLKEFFFLSDIYIENQKDFGKVYIKTSFFRCCFREAFSLKMDFCDANLWYLWYAGVPLLGVRLACLSLVTIT